MLKTFKHRLYPTKEQRRLLAQQLEECRWLYNRRLAERTTAWEQRQVSVSYHGQAKSLPMLKAERPSLARVQSQVLQNVAVRIDLAFKAFFRRCKAGEEPGYPPLPWEGPLRQLHLPTGAGGLSSGRRGEAPAGDARRAGEACLASPAGRHPEDRDHQPQPHRYVVRLLLLRVC
jgi:putative transposase